MKKVLGISFGLLLCLAFAIPATADVTLDVTIKKNKDINVVEFVEIEKTVVVDVSVKPESVAEAKAMANQVNTNDRGWDCFDFEVKDPFSGLTDSILGNSGIVGVNQAPGVANNQGNVVGMAATKGKVGALSKGTFADAQSAVEQENDFDVKLEFGAVSAGLISGSISGNDGVVGVNQATGCLNNQANVVAVAAGLGNGPFMSLAEADLGQRTACPKISDLATARVDVINGSIKNNNGIVGVNQASGCLNNQANVVSISAAQ